MPDRPPPRAGAADPQDADEPDIAALETQLAAQGGRRDVPPAGARRDAAARRGRRPAVGRWLSALPTLVWLAAVGFTLGALIALS